MSENPLSTLDKVPLKSPLLDVSPLLQTGPSTNDVVHEDGSPTHMIVDEVDTRLATRKKYSNLLKCQKYDEYIVELVKASGDEIHISIAVSELVPLVGIRSSDAHVIAMLKNEDSMFIPQLLGVVESNFALVQVVDQVLYIFTLFFEWIDPKILDKFAMSLVILALRTLSAKKAYSSAKMHACVLLDTITSSSNQQQHLDKFKTAGGFDLFALVLAYCGDIRVYCEQKSYKSTSCMKKFSGALYHVFELLARFSHNWKRPPGILASPGVGIEDDIIGLMRGFASKDTIQTRGCIILCGLAELNIGDFDTRNNRCITTVLLLLHKVPQDYHAQDLVCMTLQKLMGVRNTFLGNPDPTNKVVQNAIGDTGTIPLILMGIQNQYDINNVKADMTAHLQCYIDLLVSLTVGNTINCRRVFKAGGVTLLAAIIVARKTQKKNCKIETSCIQVICHIYTILPDVDADVDADFRRKVIISACVAKTCGTTNSKHSKRAAKSPMQCVLSCGSNSGTSDVVLLECIRMVTLCAQVLEIYEVSNIQIMQFAMDIFNRKLQNVPSSLLIKVQAVHLISIVTAPGRSIGTSDKCLTDIIGRLPNTLVTENQMFIDAVAKLQENRSGRMSV